MHYVSAVDLEKSYGIKPLFAGISFHISEGDKIALVARNGSGKSTLLKIIAGKEFADEGKIWVNKNIEIAFFEQEPELDKTKTILDNIFHIAHPVINIIKDYELAVEEGDQEKISQGLVLMEEKGAWDFDAKVKQILGKLNIHNLQQNVATLSGGQLKRIALARTLIDIGFEHKHVLLIMDEPTNHLDVEMVEWLEHYLGKEHLTLLLVTHDRYFLDEVCTEVWELENGQLYFHKGNYENYLEKKALREEALSASVDKARNIYRKELEWMRKQPKARTTKSKSRIEAFYQVEHQARQQVKEQQMELQSKMNRLGGKTVEMKKVSKSFGEKTILKGFDYIFKKGERVGVVGKNGTGKTTFINIIQGLEPADSGKINIGDTVVFGNYSQQGLFIKEDIRVIEYVKQIAENFPLANGGTLTASQFLGLFLFPPEQQFTYINSLSGGEKRRLHLLTVLFRNPNFLILDEPTNDLDLPTLSVLENFLIEFQGCLVIVSHDRYFMDRLVDHLFVFEGNAIVSDFPGNYSQYRESGRQRDAAPSAVSSGPSMGNTEPVTKKKLSYKEQREFDQLEKEIRELELQKKVIYDKLAMAEVAFPELKDLSEKFNEIASKIDEKELRWLYLSEAGS